MANEQSSVLAAVSALVVVLSGCSSGGGGGTTTNAGAGGLGSATGGAAGARSGDAGTGAVLGTGGRSETGDMAAGPGGRSGTGGAAGTGESYSGSAGVGNAGAAAGNGGVQSGRGGASGTGGGTAAGTGGNAGASAGGSGATTPVDPNAIAAINACMDGLPWGARDMSADERAPIVTSIIKACAEFAPPGAEWQKYCQMFLVGAINAESSYNTQAGSVGAGDDPTIGLLQIRFSSTVRDFADYGPVDALKRAGCDFGTVTQSDSYATKSAMMLDVNCNVAIGTWYYFIFGSGNGGSDAVWVDEYCQGDGVAGSLHIGMACHLMGAEAAHSSLSGADSYYNNIKSWFDPCVSYSGTHPFELPLEPDTDRYCR